MLQTEDVMKMWDEANKLQGSGWLDGIVISIVIKCLQYMPTDPILKEPNEVKKYMFQSFYV